MLFSFALAHQADENIFERALMGVEEKTLNSCNLFPCSS